MPTPGRRSHLVLLLGILAMAGIGRWLTPDASGHGTHRQLGLPPCPLFALTHRRCPACGLTTSISHIMHGQWHRAWRAHPLGPVLVCWLAMAAGASLYGCWRPFSWRKVCSWDSPKCTLFTAGTCLRATASGTSAPMSNQTPVLAPPTDGPGARAIAALALGILALIPCLGPLTGIPAMWLGRAEMTAIRRGAAHSDGRSLAKVGSLLGTIGSIVTVVVGILWALLVGVGLVVEGL